MVVEVRLFATLREGRFNKKMVDLPDNSSLGDLLKDLKIAGKGFGILLANGRSVSPGYTLAPNDVVSIFPPLGGG